MLWPIQVALNAVCSYLPCNLQTPFAVQLESHGLQHRVAIIGAGAAGTSAAFWIAKASERANLSIAIDIYDKSSYIGGRSAIAYPYDNISNVPIELGASIFIAENKNLMRAASEFNLTLVKFTGSDQEVGIWDGEQFTLKMGGSGLLQNWWNKLRTVWRYGYNAPSLTLKAVRSTVSALSPLYSSNPPKWNEVSEVASILGLTSQVAQTASEYFEAQGIDPRWTREVAEAATRANYADNVDTIHGVAGSISLATDAALGVEGGNYQIFENFISHSGARVHLDTTVTRLQKSNKEWVVETSQGTKHYDTVILAAPFTDSLEIDPKPDTPLEITEYTTLHVTLLSTSSPRPSKEYFANDTSAPTSILTTFQGARSGRKEPPFYSLSYRGQLSSETEEWVVKILSKRRLTAKFLSKLFDGQIGWVLRKEWSAFPVMKPRVDLPQVKIADGLYYANGFEPFISSMETQTISSRNIVDLFIKEQFNTTLCPQSNGTPTKDYVYGWDC